MNLVWHMDTLKKQSEQLARHLSTGAERRMRSIQQHWTNLKKSLFNKLYAALLLGCLSAGGNSTAQATTLNKDDEVAEKVYAIISYAKWDNRQQPIQLCITGSSKFADALETAGQAAYWPRVNVTKQHYDAKLLGSQCDVIFFGNIPPAQQQNVIAERQNRPLLTISEGNADCEIGSSFCLEAENSPVTFKVNLDSLTRSGIYVNPNVLLLGRKKTSP